MSFFTIAGHASCVHYAHAIYVANYLNSKLPSFKFRQVDIEESNWLEYLWEIKDRYGWCINKSPIVWKQLTRFGGKPYLVGCLGEFWEHCLDFYGLVSFIPKNQLENIIKDRQAMAHRRKENADKETIVVGIVGAANIMLSFLVHDLRRALNMLPTSRLIINVHDDEDDHHQHHDEVDVESHWETVVKVSSQADAIKNAHLLLIIQDLRRDALESEKHWLRRCFIAMRSLADNINTFANPQLRVIVSHWGPVCFTASVLVQFCTVCRPANIVAVTADCGSVCVPILVRRQQMIPVNRIGAPAVWGSPHLATWVDWRNVTYMAEVVQPLPRASNVNKWPDSTLPLARIRRHLRQMVNLLEDSIEVEVEGRRQILEESLQRPAILAKVTATIQLISTWYSDVVEGDFVMSLGVCSNGAFDLPTGIVLSQPVLLNSSKIWQPFTDFPLNMASKSVIAQKITEIEKVMNEFGISNSRKASAFINPDAFDIDFMI